MSTKRVGSCGDGARGRGEKRCRVAVCTAAGCLSIGRPGRARGARAGRASEARPGGRRCEVFGTGCLGLCDAGPLVQVEPDEGTRRCCTRRSTRRRAARIAAEDAVERQRRRGDLLDDANAAFFAKQRKIVLENSGRIDPERIESYIAAGGYAALQKAVTEMTPPRWSSEVTASGPARARRRRLPDRAEVEHGRQGAGATRSTSICNADEGDPGAFMDRSVLEGDPHRVLEGMAIAAYAIGAEQGYIYVRGEYPLAIARLQDGHQAGRAAAACSGSRILDTGFNFRIDIRIGAGAFVCGEETALIASIEGKRGTPRPRPPYPAAVGPVGPARRSSTTSRPSPTSPPIIAQRRRVVRGDRHREEQGHEGLRPGRQDRAHRPDRGADGHARCARSSSTSAAASPTARSSRPSRPAARRAAASRRSTSTCRSTTSRWPSVGSIMGSGGLIVMDETSCMVDVARYFMEFCRDESCGKCMPCRAGTVQMHGLLDKITRRRGHRARPRAARGSCATCSRSTSLCGLGQTAPNPVLSTLRYFRDEYVAHIDEQRCPAGRLHDRRRRRTRRRRMP